MAVLRQLPTGFQKMGRDEFRKAIQATIDAANKRLKRLEESKMISPAYQSAMSSGGKFTLRGKNRNELIKEGARAIAFINMKTSTVKGARSYENSFISKLSNKAKGITDDQRAALFDGFRKIEQISPVGLNLYGSDRLIRLLADSIVDNNNDFSDMMQNALRELEKEYETAQMDYLSQLGDIWDL